MSSAFTPQEIRRSNLQSFVKDEAAYLKIENESVIEQATDRLMCNVSVTKHIPNEWMDDSDWQHIVSHQIITQVHAALKAEAREAKAAQMQEKMERAQERRQLGTGCRD